jgi:hypothetical protein
MKLYATAMSVLLALSLPVAGICADASKDAANPAGKVVQTLKGSGYTYAELDKDGKKIWVAYQGPDTKVGDALSFTDCVEMKNFPSKALNRTFDSIFFCGQPGTPTAAAGTNVAIAKKKSPGSEGAAATGKAPIKVEKATGANAYTVAQVFAKSAALNGKTVVVRGQVVKVSTGIMKRTWIHLQDGTGSAKQKTQDLVVTTTEKGAANVGDVITISGTLAKDKDFGSGYKYSVIVEKGKINK